MKKTRLIVALLLAVMMIFAFVLVACDPEEPPTPPIDTTLEYADGTVLRSAIGYDGVTTGISFAAAQAGSGITLSDGVTYKTGDLKPTWVEMEKRLNVKFEDIYTGKNNQDEWNNWEPQLGSVDIVCGTATLLQKAGAAGKVVNLADYLEYMPNFKAFLDANPIVYLSLIGSTSGSSAGAIYFSPYFDGENDIERMPLMRTDWVEALLNGTSAFSGVSKDVTSTAYTSYIDSTKNIDVESLTKDGSGTQTIEKNFAAAKTALETKYSLTLTTGNIVDAMNAYIATGSKTGVELVNFFRTYIDACYGTTYTAATRANLFIGYDACWDADELVAMLRCVVNNPQTLNGTDKVAGLFPRESSAAEANGTQRMSDLASFAGQLFGVRGVMESRQNHLYFDSEGNLRDSRNEPEAYEAMNRMNQMYREGLIAENFYTVKASSSNYVRKHTGFMSYDYSQTQTLHNNFFEAVHSGYTGTPTYTAVMVPVALWFDGENVVSDVDQGTYMRFTDSWRSVKPNGLAISVAGIGNDINKLNAALTFFDYAYSTEGQVLMSYGPDVFIETDSDDNWVTFDFNGKQCPVMSEGSLSDLTKFAGGNYTDYARKFLGSTLFFAKMQSFEFQCTVDAGKIGAGKVSAAIGAGTIKHPELAIMDNMWYTIIPTAFPHTTAENSRLDALTAFGSGHALLWYSNNSSKDAYNLYVDIMSVGLGNAANDARIGTFKATGEEMAAYMRGLGGDKFMVEKNAAWTRLLAYYFKNF